MRKKVIAMVLCLGLMIVSASAAMGRVYCDMISNVTTKGTYEAAATKTIAEENTNLSASKIMNIYALAYLVDYHGSDVRASKHTTSHYVRSTSALTDDVLNSLYVEPIMLQAMGLARTRYTDNTVSEHQNTGLVLSVGGDYMRHAAVSKPDNEQQEEYPPFGSGKKDAMVALIQDTYGYNLNDFSYVPTGALDTDEVKGETLRAILDISIDIGASAEVGDKIPFGYLYQGNTAYAIVEQSDGTVKLTQYQLLFEKKTRTESNGSAMGESSVPLYRVVDEETSLPDADVLAALYA